MAFVSLTAFFLSCNKNKKKVPLFIERKQQKKTFESS
jgi:hypothetical protein